MRDITSVDALGAVKAGECILELLAFDKSDVVLVIERVEVANEGNAELAAANVFARNGRLVLDNHPVVLRVQRETIIRTVDVWS